MKAREVPALWKRGLRREGGAEPQIESVRPWADTHPNNRKQPSNLKKESRHYEDLSTQKPSVVVAKARRPSVQAAKRKFIFKQSRPLRRFAAGRVANCFI
jgi:hypothetical protein